MKKYRAWSLPLAFLLSIIILWGCRETDPPLTLKDTKNPWIVMTSPVPMPVGSYNHVGDNDVIDVDIRFEDDVELKDYKILIRYNKQLNYLKTDNDIWEKTIQGTLEGNTDGLNTTLKIASDPSAGPYEFIVIVNDAAGKSDTLTTYLFVTNQRDIIAPDVQMTKPNPLVVDTVWRDTMYIKGQLSDANGVKDAYMRVRTMDNQIVPGSELWLDTLFAGIYNIDTFLVISGAQGEKDHMVEVYAHDEMLNTGSHKYKIYIK